MPNFFINSLAEAKMWKYETAWSILIIFGLVIDIEKILSMTLLGIDKI